MITIRWTKFPGADVVSYNIYRSIIGFKAPIVDLTGKTLILKIDGGNPQTINFTGPDTIFQINSQLKCAAAYPASTGCNPPPPTDFILRSNTREAPGSVEIVGGTALADLGLTPKLITEKSDPKLIANVIDPNTEYTDYDGTPSDYYSITTIDSQGTESGLAPWKKGVPTAGPLCVIEGLIINAQGARIADAEVIATIQVPPERLCKMIIINKDPISTLSGPDGRFSLPLLQGLLVRLEIPAIDYIRMIVVPELPYVFLNDLPSDDRYQYPLGYQSNPALGTYNIG